MQQDSLSDKIQKIVLKYKLFYNKDLSEQPFGGSVLENMGGQQHRAPRAVKELTPIPFAGIADRVLADLALNMASTVLSQLTVIDQTANRDSGHIRLFARIAPGDLPGNDPFTAVGDKYVGPGVDERFAVNTAGKASTCIRYHLNSDDAVRLHGFDVVADSDPNDPRGWPGGIYYMAVFEVGVSTYTLEVISAFSGVQGAFDKIIAYAVATYYAGLMQLRMQEEYEQQNA